MIIPQISTKQAEDIIRKSKNSSARGFNETSMKFLKITPKAWAPLIAFAINKSLNAGKFPEILKTSRILPILKQGKDKFSKESYRPISNLHCMEKIFEEHIKTHLNIHCEENDIILKNHHGGLKGRSTLTARAVIETEIEKQYQENKLVVAASTDLSAAYDTVDHKILLMKLEYYGVEGSELNLFRSYLDNRKQYTDINTKKSATITCLPCGVVQGSKLSGLLYTLYTNEVPLLQNILNNNEICETIGIEPQDTTTIEHVVVNFVDDSNSVIAANPGTDLDEYTNRYFRLLEIYYNSQKLKINTDKTQILVCSMPRFIDEIKNLEIITQADIENVKPKAQIKILGFLINGRGNIDNQLNALSSVVGGLLHIANKYKNIMTKPARKDYIFAHVISRINYILPFCAGHTLKNKDKVKKILIKSAKFIYGGNTRRLPHDVLFERVGFPRRSDYFEIAAATWMHKIIHQNNPEMITEYIRHPKYRKACKVAPIIKPRTTRFKRTAIASGIHYYNKLHTNTAKLEPKKCKKLIYTMDKYDEEPKTSDRAKINKSSNQNDKEKSLQKTNKKIINTNYYAQAKVDNSKYYEFITNLFETPKLDNIDIRINDMERSLYAMIDEEDTELAPPHGIS